MSIISSSGNLSSLAAIASAIALTGIAPVASSIEPTVTEDLFFQEIPVVLTATRLKQSAADSPASITVIDRQMIEASGALRLVELFRLIPGMQLGYVSGSRFTASLHGMADRYARRLQVMVDGRPVYDPGFGGVSWFDLPVDIGDIERIEAIRGPNAAAYGSNAFSGIINIITRHPAADQGTRTSATLGEQDTRIASLAHSGSSGSLDYRITLKHQEDSGFENRFDRSSQDWMNVRGDWQINTTDSLLAQFGISDGFRKEGFPDDLENFPRKNDHQYNYQQIRWSRQPDVDREYVVQFYHNHLDIDDDFLIPVPDDLVYLLGGVPPLSMGWGFESDRYDIEFQGTRRVSPALRLVLGAGARHDESRSIWMFGTPETIERDQARLFLNAEWHATGQLVGNLGLMTEFTDGFEPLFSPRLGLNYHIDRSNTVRVSASQAYRMPSLFEENAGQMIYMGEERLPFNRLFISDDSLDPERVRSIEIGYLGDFPEHGITLDARLFKERMTSLLTHAYDYRVEDPVPPPGQPGDDLYGADRVTNGGNVDIHGLEIGFKYAPTTRGFLYLGYSYLNADGTQLRVDPYYSGVRKSQYRQLGPQVPRRLLSVLGSYRFDNGIRLSSGFYHSHEVTWAGDGDEVPSYHRWDVKVDRTFKLGKTDLDLAVIYRHIGADQIDFYNQPEDDRINEWSDALFLEAGLRFR